MHVLVTAASRHEATAEIAAAIRDRLVADGLTVDLVAPHEVMDLDGYDAVVLGSAVYMGRWLEPARDLVNRLAEDLQARPVWLFSSGPVGDPPAPDEDVPELEDLLALSGARGYARFGGRVERGRLGPVERTVMRAFRVPDGDNRDWDSVAAWADQVAHALRTQHIAGPLG
jgi:menaquinone-dependent protoporphyrinogen oxidase